MSQLPTELPAEASATQAPLPESVEKALSVIGAWADMDWEEALEELERIGHEVPPTPPIEDL